MAFLQGFGKRDTIAKGGAGAVGIIVLGVPELAKALGKLSSSGSRNAASAGLRAGLVPVVKAIKRQTRSSTKKVTGTLVKSVGSRLARQRRTGLLEARAGFNVASTKAGSRTTATGKVVRTRVLAPHAHFVALGTKARYDDKHNDAFRGAMTRNPIVPTAYAQSKGVSLAAMKTKCLQVIEKETIKARARTRRK